MYLRKCYCINTNQYCCGHKIFFVKYVFLKHSCGNYLRLLGIVLQTHKSKVKCTYLLTKTAGNKLNFYILTQYLIYFKQLFSMTTYENKQNWVLTVQIFSGSSPDSGKKHTNRQWENSLLQGLAASEQAVTFQLSLIFTSYSSQTYLFIDVNIERPWGQTSNSGVQIRGSVKTQVINCYCIVCRAK